MIEKQTYLCHSRADKGLPLWLWIRYSSSSVNGDSFETTFIVELLMLVPPTKSLNNEITFIVELVMLVSPNKSLNNETKF